MCLLIWTVFSGERCGPWASWYCLQILYIYTAIACKTQVHVTFVYNVYITYTREQIMQQLPFYWISILHDYHSLYLFKMSFHIWFLCVLNSKVGWLDRMFGFVTDTVESQTLPGLSSAILSGSWILSWSISIGQTISLMQLLRISQGFLSLSWGSSSRCLE